MSKGIDVYIDSGVHVEGFTELTDEAKEIAKKIGSFSKPAVQMAKESINRSFETSLSEGLRFERRLFHAMFSTADQKEGMAAFIEKREANFTNK